jgi:trehalose 6-phosphate synthase/phosphatase
MEQVESQRILVVSASLPYTIKSLSSQPVAEPSLIPETVGKSEVPPRRRRRSKVSSSSIIDIIAELTVSDKAEEPSCPEILSIEADSRHPSFLTQATNLPAIYIGLSEHNSEHALELYERKNCLPVYHPSHASFEIYCTKVLSRLFHYSLFETRNVDLKLINEGWKDFTQVNQAVADAIMNVYREGDIVWIMDFRMLGVAGHLRDWNKLIPIGLHLNVPFPSSEVFTCLPHAKEVLEAMLSCSVVSFQAYSYIRHFISSSARLLGLESTPFGIEFNGLPIHLTVVPIGVDVERIREDIADESAQSKLEAMRKVFKGKRVLLGIDTMESMKGVKHKLQGFEMFLEIYPSWIGEVILVQVMSPDNVSIQIDPTIVNLAAKINNRFGYLGYNPVSLFNINLQQEEYLALLTIAELFLVISERAAYSIPALDYIVCQEKRHGLIMLSEFIGNTIFQPAAFIVNPWDHKVSDIPFAFAHMPLAENSGIDNGGFDVANY